MNQQIDNCRPHPTEPCVGIFWFVPAEGGTSTIVTDMTPVANAPDYGDLKTHDRGHHEYWSGLARLGATPLRLLGLPSLIATAPYETYPRGRIVFDPRRQHYAICADRRLHKRAFIDAIVCAFDLPEGGYTLWADLHYARSRPVSTPG